MKIRFKKLDAKAVAPQYATIGSAGADIRSTENIVIGPNETKRVHTGLAMEIPAGFVGFLFPRSGLSFKTSLRQPNSVGVIDSDYRGEVQGMFTNTGSEPVEIASGDRIAQMIVMPVPYVVWAEAESLEDTARGAGGFGSTGV